MQLSETFLHWRYTTYSRILDSQQHSEKLRMHAYADLLVGFVT